MTHLRYQTTTPLRGGKTHESTMINKCIDVCNLSLHFHRCIGVLLSSKICWWECLL